MLVVSKALVLTDIRLGVDVITVQGLAVNTPAE